MKKITVENISQYFDEISCFDGSEYISRGEFIDNNSTRLLSSALRNKEFSWHKCMEKYNLDVVHRLTSLQKEYFTAFSQHHHIHTNLLDFSNSYLVSLFFAVNNSFEEEGLKDLENNEGYVYFIDRKRCIDINDLIKEKPSDWGLLWDLYFYEKDTISFLVQNSRSVFVFKNKVICRDAIKTIDNIIELLEKDNVDVDNIKNIHIKYSTAFKRADSEGKNIGLYKAFSKYLEKSIDALIDICKGIHYFHNNIFDTYTSIRETSKGNTLDYALDGTRYNYFLLYSIYFHLMPKNYNRRINEITMPFYFTYIVPAIDDRIANQQSLFVFQPYTDSGFVQKIVPDYVLEVINKNHLLNQLKSAGIDEKFIFNDFDSIGKYNTKNNKEEAFFICDVNDKESDLMFDEKGFFAEYENIQR